MQVKLQGIPGIRKVFMREKQETRLRADGTFGVDTHWVLDTDGVNLMGVSLRTSWFWSSQLFQSVTMITA